MDYKQHKRKTYKDYEDDESLNSRSLKSSASSSILDKVYDSDLLKTIRNPIEGTKRRETNGYSRDGNANANSNSYDDYESHAIDSHNHHQYYRDHSENQSSNTSRSNSPRNSKFDNKLSARRSYSQDEMASQRTTDRRDEEDSHRRRNDDDILYDKQTRVLNKLLTPNENARATASGGDEISKKAVSNEKDPEIIDTLEDTKLAEKLRKEREQKRILRETKGKNKTEITQKTEEVIEKLENSIEDKQRIEKMKKMSESLTYPTKPPLREFLQNEKIERGRSANANANLSRKKRSNSLASERSQFNDKYANVKPKIQTRVATSAIQAYSSTTNLNRSINNNINSDNNSTSYANLNANDRMNNSFSLREGIYNEWYTRKIVSAREKLSESKLAQQNEEEKKAQELINKLQKSKIAFQIWNEEKENRLKERKKMEEIKQLSQEEEERKKKDKIKDAEMAFKEWLRRKKEQDKEKQEEKIVEERKAKREIRNKKDVSNHKKPPLPFDTWSKTKEAELNEKIKLLSEKKQQSLQAQEEKYKRKALAKQSFNEWLIKKEQSQQLNKSLNKSEHSFINLPFYPASKTISFGN